jgi:hypothetical protein
MIAELRKRYNKNFTQAKYTAMMDWITEQYGYRPTFNVAESPLFIDEALGQKVLRACDDILKVVTAPDFVERSMGAIPPGENVPNQTENPMFLQFDFGLCRGEDGTLEPQLIEGQGFPSLYFFQYLLDKAYRKHFEIPEDFKSRFGGLRDDEYMELLRRCIHGDYPPENVILLEVDPIKQNTRIDFIIACKQLGIAEVCISDVDIENGALYYDLNGKRTRIHRIFNRVIFDELKARPDLKRRFNMIEQVDVEWAGHPNWFFLISKYTLPLLKGPYVPDTHFLHQLEEYPEDLSKYVLKPLYSFAGAGVDLYPTAEKLAAIERPEHYILQRKVQYADVIETPDVPARAELRMMFVWPPDEDKPKLLNNLVRLSKGEMVGVQHNKGKTWVGGSLGYFA